MEKGNKHIRGGTKAAALAAVFAASVLVTACGSKEYLKDIKASDYVNLGNYTGIEASAEEPAVEENLVDMYIENYILAGHAVAEEVTGRAVAEGDTANIDFIGYIDGEAFDGGAGSDFDLTIGAHQFIDGFEEGLIGAYIGETVKLELAFPDPYLPNPDLSGVPVSFEVTVNGITRQTLPELTDDFVQSLGIEGCETKKELRDYVYNYFYESAVQTYENTIETMLTNAAMADCTFKEPPAGMVERFTKNIKDVMNSQAVLQNMTLVDYMRNYYGMSVEEYEEKFRKDGLEAAQQYIMFQAIADVEGLNPTAEQIREEIGSRVETYGYESEAAYRESMDMELFREQLMRRNVMEFIKENGNITMESTIVD